MNEIWAATLRDILQDLGDRNLAPENRPDLHITWAGAPSAGNLAPQIRDMAIGADSIGPIQDFRAEPEEMGFSLVAFRNGRIIGQISLHLDEDRRSRTLNTHLDAIFIDRHERNSGAARALAQAALGVLEKVMCRMAGQDMAAFEHFDPIVSADTNSGGEAIRRIIERRIEDLAEEIDVGALTPV